VTLQPDLPPPFIAHSRLVGPTTTSFTFLSSKMSDHDQSPGGPAAEAPQPPSEHLNIKVTDGNNEVFFKIKRSTKLEKLMNAFCERQGKQISTVRFLFDGQRVQPGDSPDTVSPLFRRYLSPSSRPLISLTILPSATCLMFHASAVHNSLVELCADLWHSLTWPMAILWKFIRSRLVVIESWKRTQ
jgi:Ubiquitin-2 like Rad60 SUMO-like